MSTFVARTSKQIFRDILAKVVANLGGLNIDSGGPETAIIAAVAEEMGLHEARLEALVQAHGLDAAATDLDDVVAQIMSGMAVRRGGATASGGAAMRIERSSSVGSLVVPVGTTFFLTSDRKVRFATTEEVELADGQLVWPGPGDELVRVRCLTPGRVGNVRAGTVTGLDSVPSAIVSATNVEPIGGGQDVERDSSLRQRARMLLSSIAKSQPSALRFLAGRWIAQDGTAIRHAATFEDPEIPGYTELLLDDGEGLPGITRTAVVTSGVVPPTGSPYLWFDGPAATEPFIRINGSDAVQLASLPGAVVIYERGRVEFAEGYGLDPGDEWEIGGDTQHLVYTGAVAEVQRVVEGDTYAGAVTDYGWRAAGTRVRVRPPLVADIAITLRVEFTPDVTIVEGRRLVTDAVVEFVRSLAPGEAFTRFDLIVEIGKLVEVVNCEVIDPIADVRPLTPRHRVSTAADLIAFE